MTSGPTIKMRRKMLWIVIGLTLCGFFVLIGKLFLLQLIEGQSLQQKAIEQQLRDIDISPGRGTIYDTNMKTLAASATVWTVCISPGDIDDKNRTLIANGLSEILGVSKDFILEKTYKKNYYEVVKRKVEWTVAEKVRTFANDNEIYSISLVQDSKRYYPYNNFLANVLGFTGTDNQGLSGLEAYYDKYLTGTAGRVVSAKNAWGDDMPFQYKQEYDAQDGNSLVLTIDETIQHFLEKNLEVAASENLAKSASGIVMNVKTGAILAMATKPDYDPNDPFTVTSESIKKQLASLSGDSLKTATSAALSAQWRNTVISDLYEPGSVFKLVTSSAALEEKVTSVTDTYTCTGSITIAGTKMHCWKPGGHGTQTFVQGLCNSCNPFFVTLGQRLGVAKFCEYFNAYGLNEKTGIDLPGEAQSLFYTPSTMGPVELSSSAFGQSNKITPLQMITAAAAVVNGGKLVTPYIVERIIDKDGNIISSKQSTVKRTVVSEETSRTIASILETNVNQYGGKNVYISGYRIGGKSGTAQKLDSENKNAIIASFLAFAPANDPEIAVLIYVDEPHGASNYGSIVAAPVVRDVLSDVLPYLGIEKQYTEQEINNADVITPSVNGLNITMAKNRLAMAGLKYKEIGTGATVVKQVPEAGQEIPNGGTVILYMDDTGPKSATVPNLLGMSVSQANSALTNSGLNMRIVGGGVDKQNVFVSGQSVAAGTKVEIGTTVTVEFINNSVQD